MHVPEIRRLQFHTDDHISVPPCRKCNYSTYKYEYDDNCVCQFLCTERIIMLHVLSTSEFSLHFKFHRGGWLNFDFLFKILAANSNSQILRPRFIHHVSNSCPVPDDK
jgi:hypothetical protein